MFCPYRRQQYLQEAARIPIFVRLHDVCNSNAHYITLFLTYPTDPNQLGEGDRRLSPKISGFNWLVVVRAHLQT